MGTDPFNPDTDEDGVLDGKEISDGTNPLNACSLIRSSQTNVVNIAKWNLGDCDNDNVKNGHELDTDTDGDGIPNFLDEDDDGDGLFTIDESPDPNNDNNPNDAADANRNGVPDYLEPNKFNTSVPDDLEVYNVVTPNGDGVHDIFTIRNIELYPNNNVSIFNRWGQLVYFQNGYGTAAGIPFEGRHKDTGELLPVGVYFYVLEYKTSSGELKKRQGFLYING